MDDILIRRLLEQPQPLVEEGHSGYFTKPEATLDPRLFNHEHFRADVRHHLLKTLRDFWRSRYINSDTWSTVWVAGSGVSHQWHGDRGGLGDLDVLIGVDYPKFLQLHPDFAGIPEPMIAARFNNELAKLLSPSTASWNGFEVTWYINPGATDIRDIHPYAAYDLTHDKWTVTPENLPADWGPKYFPKEWHTAIGTEIKQAQHLIERYQQEAEGYHQAAAGPQTTNAETRLRTAAEQAGALFADIHDGRKNAFSARGDGYRDWYNFRWQSHKRAGTEQALRAIHDGLGKARESVNEDKYGAKDISNRRAVLEASLAPHGRKGLL